MRPPSGRKCNLQKFPIPPKTIPNRKNFLRLSKQFHADGAFLDFLTCFNLSWRSNLVFGGSSLQLLEIKSDHFVPIDASRNLEELVNL